MPGQNILGNCSDCCSCPTPYLAYVTRSASKSKSSCSFFNAGDGQYYYTSIFSYNQNGNVSNGGCSQISCNSSINYTETTSYSPTGCSTSCNGFGNGSFTQTENLGGMCGLPCDIVANQSSTMISCGIWSGTQTTQNDSCGQTSSSIGSVNECGPPGIGITTYTNLYTTPNLQSNTVAGLPDWGQFTTGGASCLQLASSELIMSGNSYSIEQGQYFFLFQVPPTMKYTINWNVVFIPDSGIPTILSTQSYNWNGPSPMDYTPTGQLTWPKTPTYTVINPPTNGIISLSGITYVCGKNFSGQVC